MPSLTRFLAHVGLAAPESQADDADYPATIREIRSYAKRWMVLVFTINVAIGGEATQYLVERWVGYIQHHPVAVPFPLCAIAGAFVGEVTVPLAIVTWLLSFVMGGLR